MVLQIILTVFHVGVGLILIGVVLLQTGKRADLAGAFGGGGSQTAFGTRGVATLLSKLTTMAAISFMVTSMWLSIEANKRAKTTSVLDRVSDDGAVQQTAPAPGGDDAAAGLPVLPETDPVEDDAATEDDAQP